MEFGKLLAAIIQYLNPDTWAYLSPAKRGKGSPDTQAWQARQAWMELFFFFPNVFYVNSTENNNPNNYTTSLNRY